ncbi:hypothetical protein HRI_001426700 [Hibiscus trionum]|uniref:Uncharacterized protein n=1 Tax=Hibiscus trionum TaxID=183268 RepID=A0A9W7HHK4_HIBTR|nr:hypothetical protein HRI_001426700 [Hibiscus trionum]
MENPITAKYCINRPWFVLLVFFVFCIEMLRFDCSGFTAKKSKVLSVLDYSHENLVNIKVSLPHDFTETNESMKMTNKEEELKVET